MSSTEATAEVFLMAFKALKPREQTAVLKKIAADEDLADALLIEKRRRQPHRPFLDVLKELNIQV